jgi:hypothetical protein
MSQPTNLILRPLKIARITTPPDSTYRLGGEAEPAIRSLPFPVHSLNPAHILELSQQTMSQATTGTNIWANSSLISYSGSWNLSSYVPLSAGATASIRYLGE